MFMTARPAIKSATPVPTSDRSPNCACCGGEAPDQTARHRAALQELAEIGMDLARALRRQVVEAAAVDGGAPAVPAAGGGDPALAFSRLARAVRLTLALEARVAEVGRAAEAERAARRADRRIRGLIIKDEVQAIAREAIEAAGRERGAEVDVERLLADLDERLEDTDEADGFADLPVGALVARICRDLGVAFDADAWDEDGDEPWDDDDDEGDGDEGEDDDPWARDQPAAPPDGPGAWAGGGRAGTRRPPDGLPP